MKDTFKFHRKSLFNRKPLIQIFGPACIHRCTTCNFPSLTSSWNNGLHRRLVMMRMLQQAFSPQEQIEFPKMKSWSWGAIYKGWKPDVNQVATLQATTTQLFTDNCVMHWFHFTSASFQVKQQAEPGVSYTIIKPYEFLKFRQSALTYDWAASPAGWTLYPPNSGGGQGHSARSASSGIQGLWVSHAEQEVIKHLVCQSETQTASSCFTAPLAQDSGKTFCLHMHLFLRASFVSGLMWQVSFL